MLPERLVTRLTSQALMSWLKLDALKCFRKTRHLADVPGADVLVETGRPRENASERLVTWLTSQALMSWLKLDAE